MMRILIAAFVLVSAVAAAAPARRV